MRKLLALLLLLVILLAACSRSDSTENAVPPPPNHGQEDDNVGNEAHDDDAPLAVSLSSRIIHTAEADIETLEFDATLHAIHLMLNDVGGFIEHSYMRTVGGRRRANFTLRIPQPRLNSIIDNLGSFGNITSLRREAENVTAQFIDTEARITALRVQEERLLYMLAQTTRIADMLELESRLTEVRFDIERQQSQLMNLQAQVDYSTLTLTIFGVAELTEPTEERGYWQQMGEDFLAVVRGVGRFLATAFRIFITISPVLVLIGLITLLVFRCIKLVNKIKIWWADKQRAATKKREAKKATKAEKETANNSPNEEIKE